jgi:flagellar biosynthesis/type III secretory pathway chaperone
MTSNIDRVLDVYEAQRKNYERILATVTKEREALMDRRPLSEVMSLLRLKERLIRDVERLDRTIRRDKQAYRAHLGDVGARGSARAGELIGSMKQLLEKILAIETENETIVSSYGAHPDDAGASPTEPTP